MLTIATIPVAIALTAPSLMMDQRPVGSDRSGCAGFIAELDKPMLATIEQVTGEALGGKPDGAVIDGRPAYRVGELHYFGAGIQAVTRDPRFRGVRVTDDRGAYHRCGYRLNIFPGPWNMLHERPSSTPAFRFARKPGVRVDGSGSTAAARAGAIPVLANFSPGPSWPLIANSEIVAFVGLMHPEDGGRETLLVRFEKPEAGTPTRVLARLPMRFQSVGIIANLHASGVIVNLSGRDPEGPYRSIALQMRDDPGR